MFGTVIEKPSRKSVDKLLKIIRDHSSDLNRLPRE